MVIVEPPSQNLNTFNYGQPTPWINRCQEFLERVQDVDNALVHLTFWCRRPSAGRVIVRIIGFSKVGTEGLSSP